MTIDDAMREAARSLGYSDAEIDELQRRAVLATPGKSGRIPKGMERRTVAGIKVMLRQMLEDPVYRAVIMEAAKVIEERNTARN